MIACHPNQVTPFPRYPDLVLPNEEIKDPSVVRAPDGTYHVYASVGSSVTQQWRVGHFVSNTPYGEWKELPSVTFEGIWGRELCAPAVTYCANRKDPWIMYIQTSCFTEDGVIVKATSTDGIHFKGSMDPILHKQTTHSDHLPVVGVYDAGISEIQTEKEAYECLLISGYRRIGCRDLYMSVRKAQDHDGFWPQANLLMSQEQLPFHNNPSYEHYEWGLEGAKIVALSPTIYLLIGVCFKPLPQGHQGTRQRVFFALSRSITGPFHPWCLPLEGMQEIVEGEHGHPDILVEDQNVWLYYQHRYGDQKPWYMKTTHFDLKALAAEAEYVLNNENFPAYAPSQTPRETTPNISLSV